MTTKQRRPSSSSRSFVRIPEKDLGASILELAAPLLVPLGPIPAADDARRAIELTIELWNAQVAASKLWGNSRTRALTNLRRKMYGTKAPPEHAETYELLSQRWRARFSLDPRLVGEWSLERTDDGRLNIICAIKLPDGIEADVSPPVEPVRMGAIGC